MISAERKRKAAAAIIILADAVRRRQSEKKRRRFWVDEMLLNRDESSFFNVIYSKLKSIDSAGPTNSNAVSSFKNFVRMSLEDFDFLLERVSPRIGKENTRFRKAISAGERLAVTFRYLATGENFTSLRFIAKMADCTISRVVHETCDAIYNVLRDDYLEMPSSTEEWEKIARVFEEQWNFPNCVGALDGKHVTIQAPSKCGSEYFNYKKINSIVLMGLVDDEYKFTYIDVGAYGRDSDGGVFVNCGLSTVLAENTINLPLPKPLPAEEKEIPYIVVADDAFPIKTYLMKSYAFRKLDVTQRVFNYRLSRARRISENVFGICAARFRVLRKPIEVNPERATKIVLAICALHNFLMCRNKSKSISADATDFDPEENEKFVPGNWRKEVSVGMPLATPQGRPEAAGAAIRDEFRKYFISENGAVGWQCKACGLQNN